MENIIVKEGGSIKANPTPTHFGVSTSPVCKLSSFQTLSRCFSVVTKCEEILYEMCGDFPTECVLP